MLTSVTVAPPRFPATIEDAVRASLGVTLGSIYGSTPDTSPADEARSSAMLTTIGFTGDPPWSLTMLFSAEDAARLATQFAGFDLPIDSPDLGDAVGELLNVLAGEVVAQLDSRQVPARMSLPTVTRGKTVEVASRPGLLVSQWQCRLPQGRFGVRLIARESAAPGPAAGRTPVASP